MERVDLDTLRRFFASSPFMADLGVEPVRCGEGEAGSTLALQPRFLQHLGVVHAGVMTSMADHTMGAAAQTLCAPGFWILTAELKVSLLRAARGVRLWCDARVLKPGRQLTFTEAEVHAEGADGTRTLVLKASATMAVTAPRS